MSHGVSETSFLTSKLVLRNALLAMIRMQRLATFGHWPEKLSGNRTLPNSMFQNGQLQTQREKLLQQTVWEHQFWEDLMSSEPRLLHNSHSISCLITMLRE